MTPWAILAFLVAIGPLIVFHELGHYLVARMCNVKVLRFSVGFGRIVWSRRFGPDQTEWAISAIPLGGYVKMLDDRNPDTHSSSADQGREYTHQSVWRRIAISAAGPLANFLLAVVVFSGLYMHGIPDSSTRMRQGAETSAAYQAGLRQGDRIVAVNGVPVTAWGELHLELLRAALDGGELRLNVVQPRGGQFSTVLPADSLKGVKPEGDILGALGLNPEFPPPVIASLAEGGAAQRAGIRVGDQLTAVDGKPVRDGLDVIKAVRSAAAGKALEIDVLRGGQPARFAVAPQPDPKTQQLRIGAGFSFETEKVTVPAGPISAVAKGAQATWDHTIMQFRLIGRIVTMQMSAKNITGMITMGDYAEQTARAGIIPFLRFMALISISLGVMNLLPIPVLDGGNLLYYSLEVLTGRPLPERATEIGQRFGVILLMMLMVLAFYNDIDRLLKIT